MIISRESSRATVRKITIFGLPYFSQHLVKLINSSCSHLKAQFVDIKREKSLLTRYFLLIRKISSSDLIYRIGGFPRKKIVQFIQILNIPLVIHWVGTDVLTARKYFKRISNHYLCKENIIHWTDAPWLVDELNEINIKSEFVPLPVSSVKEILFRDPPLFPKKFTVLSYLPKDRLNFFKSGYIIRLAREFPEISFLIVGSSGEFLKDKLSNIKFLGWITHVNKIYSKSTLLIRMTEHDGYPWTIQEALAMGRYAIWNFPFPGVFQAKNYQELYSQVNKLFTLHKEGKLTLNKEGRQYIKKELNPQILTKQVINKLSQVINSKR